MLVNRVCVITGAAKGIGKSIAEAFCSEGACIAFIDKDKEAGDCLLAQLNSIRSNNFFYCGDISEKNILENFAVEVIEKYCRVDYLINNACFSNKGILSECSYEEFNKVLFVGLTAPYYLTSLFKSYFNSGASIVNISSTRSKMSQKDTESYSAAKGGISSLTHAMAMSLSGIARVNCISPGWINTYKSVELTESDKLQHPSNRVGIAKDISRVALFLCEPNSEFINATEIVVDGGMSRRMIYHGDENWEFVK